MAERAEDSPRPAPSTAKVALTGVTGRLGGRVSELLAERGTTHLAVARDPSRLPERPGLRPTRPAAYDDPAFGEAVAGTETLLLVSASLSGRRLAEHTAAIESARSAGVSRVVYVSLLGAAPDATYVNARDHWQTEQVLAASGVRWTVVRPSYYDNTLARLADTDGVVRGPAPTGRVSLVTHADIAELLAAIVCDPTTQHDDTVLTITGPQALTLDAAIQRLTERGDDVRRFEAITAQECRLLRSVAAEPPDRAEAWVTWFQSIEAGEVAEVSDTVQTVTGHPARDIGDATAR